MEKILEIKGLKTSFTTHIGDIQAVRGTNFYLNKGEAIGIVGESGCGKSVSMMSIMGLLSSNGKIVDGEVLFEGKDISKATDKEMEQVRGNKISMIFQDPMTSLNPVLTIGDQLTEPLIKHKGMNKKEAMAEAVKMLGLVGIPSPEKRINQYPHEFSGGMRQRVMIAMGLACNPKVLIADEPTTALDVTIQAQILDLMRNIKKEHDTAILLITHDLGVVAEMADYVVVMYAGKVVEEGPVLEIFKNPSHPYTRGLLKSKPSITEEKEELYAIPGQVPNPIGIKDSCYFHERCSECMGKCKNTIPKLHEIGENHKVACWLYEEGNAPKGENK